MRYFISIFSFSLFLFSSCKNQPTLEKALTAEAYRPQYHFTPDSMWMNDPNGMVYLDGEYHLFYQYFPDSTVWGPMHWGHAVSKDLVLWNDLPIALYPDSLGCIFSGSAVIDHTNTAGFGKNAMIAIFTHHNMAEEKEGKIHYQNQSIAYSLDKGRTFTKYNGNPVIKNPGIKDFRDPKVIWHEPSQMWVLVLAARDKVKFYNSKDLKNWVHTSDFGIQNDPRLWECPDIFQMQIEGSKEQKWVLITSMQSGAPNGGTGSSYWIGDFDGKKFATTDPVKSQQWLDAGKDNYAFVTWSNIPSSEQRIVGLGWMSNWQYAQKVPSEKWRSAMTLPRKLSLHGDKENYTLRSLPVDEVAKIFNAKKEIQAKSYDGSLTILENSSTNKISLTFNKPTKGNIVIRFSNNKGNYTDVGYEVQTNKYFIDRTNSGKIDFSPDFSGNHMSNVVATQQNLQMEIYLDRSSLELFADAGRCVMTDIYFSEPSYSKAEIISSEGRFELINGSIDYSLVLKNGD